MSISFVVYDKTLLTVKHTGVCQDQMMEAQAGPGEAVLETDKPYRPDGITIVAGTPPTYVPKT